MCEAIGMNDMYTLSGKNVYVLISKRIRFHRKTYTFCPRNVYVSFAEGIRLALNRS